MNKAKSFLPSYHNKTNSITRLSEGGIVWVSFIHTHTFKHSSLRFDSQVKSLESLRCDKDLKVALFDRKPFI